MVSATKPAWRKLRSVKAAIEQRRERPVFLEAVNAADSHIK